MMKRFLRITAFILSVILVCFSFFGCNKLRELREKTAYWNGDGDIVMGDNIFKKLPENEYFYPIISDYNNMITISEEDVPLLATGFFYTDYAYMTSQKNILAVFDAESDEHAPPSYYCIEADFEDISKQMTEFFQGKLYYYEYAVYNTENMTETWETYLLTDDEVNAVVAVVTEAEPFTLPDTADIYCDYWFTLNEASSNMLFSRAVCEMWLAGSTYYIVEYDENDDYVYREVPQSMNSVFDGIFEKCIESDDQYYGYYDEEYKEYEEII